MSLKLNIKDEVSPLKTVILGIANSNGDTPTEEEAYDPKSLEHIQKGTYPIEADMIVEMDAFCEILQRHNVEVLRPTLEEGLNQIFTRDIGFVIDDIMIKANILPEREKEWDSITHIIDKINPQKLITPPEEVHIEGGDVILWKDYIFIGTYNGEDYPDHKTARTNKAGVEYIRELFPNKKIQSFDLIKSNTDPRSNALHLDCCFQPIGIDKAIIFPGGFRIEEDYKFLVNLFGKENLYEITADGMYEMFSNVFSISPNVVVSEKKFVDLNNWLRKEGFLVEEIPYYEIGKQEGLLRCSTLPLIRV